MFEIDLKQYSVFKSFNMPTSNSWFMIIAIKEKNTEYFQAVAIVAFCILKMLPQTKSKKNTLYSREYINSC